MGLRKESDKQLQMDKRDSSLRKQGDTNLQDVEHPSYHDNKPKSYKSGFQDKTKEGLSKGFETYRKELESDDYGVESSGKMAEHTFKTTKTTVNKLTDYRKNKNEYSPELVDDKQLQATKKKLIKEHSNLTKQSQTEGSGFKKVDGEYLANQSKNRGLKKASDEHLRSVQEKLGNENKNRQKKASSKITKENEQQGFLKKVINQPKNLANTAKNKGIGAYKETLENDDDGVKVGLRGSKLVKDGVRSIAQTKKVQRKSSAAKKLKGHKTKLATDSKLRKATLNPDFTKGQKTLLKKKIMRKNINKAKGKTPLTLTQMSQKTGLAVKNGVNAIKKVSSVLLKRVMASKVFAVAGAVLVKLFPVFIIMGILIGIIVIVMSMGGGGGQEEMTPSIDNIQGLDPEVEQWRDLVTEVASEKGMTDYIDLALAIIQVETGGTSSKDIMQSSESAGYPPNYFTTEKASVEQGLSHLKNVISILKGYNSDYLSDAKLIAQTYNFGLGFARYVGSNKYDGYSVEISEKYSRDVVAVSLGNTTGSTYPYVNEISKSVGKPYLYNNGGNFLYGELVGQYQGSGGNGEWIYPIKGSITVTSPYGVRVDPFDGTTTGHKGIDFACTNGVTPINAVSNGKVIYSDFNTGGFGNLVMIQHGDVVSHYAHMSDRKVKIGDTVKQGQQIGVCGSTGRSTGPHLHFEAKKPQANLFTGQFDPMNMLGEWKWQNKLNHLKKELKIGRKK